MGVLRAENVVMQIGDPLATGNSEIEVLDTVFKH
jgi:hypothetical protein